MIRNKLIKSSGLPVALLSATLAFGVSPIYNKVYAATMIAQQTIRLLYGASKWHLDLRNGDCTFVDLNGDGIIDSQDVTLELGYTEDPEYTIGLNLGFSWKRL